MKETERRNRKAAWKNTNNSKKRKSLFSGLLRKKFGMATYFLKFLRFFKFQSAALFTHACSCQTMPRGVCVICLWLQVSFLPKMNSSGRQQKVRISYVCLFSHYSNVYPSFAFLLLLSSLLSERFGAPCFQSNSHSLTVHFVLSLIWSTLPY